MRESEGWLKTSNNYISLYRVMVTGIYRAMPMRVNPRQRNIKSVFKTYIDVVHFRKADFNRLRGREEEEEDDDECEEKGRKTFSRERMEQLHTLSRLPDIYERLAKALGEFMA